MKAQYRKRVITFPVSSDRDRSRAVKCLRKHFRKKKIPVVVTGLLAIGSDPANASVWAYPRDVRRVLAASHACQKYRKR